MHTLIKAGSAAAGAAGVLKALAAIFLFNDFLEMEAIIFVSVRVDMYVNTNMCA